MYGGKLNFIKEGGKPKAPTFKSGTMSDPKFHLTGVVRSLFVSHGLV
jgi:hypothetical protein